MKNKIVSFIKNFIVFIILLMSYTLLFSMIWVYNTFGNIGLEEIMFQINVPMTGTNTDYYYNYAQNALTYIILCTFFSFLVINIIFSKKKNKAYPKRMKTKDSFMSTSLVVFKKKMDKKYIAKLIATFLILIFCVTYTIQKTELIPYIENITADSNFIKEEYIDPNNVNLQFPETKRNLIYIYLESMESTYYSQENGGAYEQSLIEDLEELAKENIAFSNSNTLKGLHVLPGATWTVGAMTAQTFGIPLKIPIEMNSYGKYDSFLPKVKGIGDILKEQGYNQMLAIGSDAEFGGRDHLYVQHGDFKIFDFKESIVEEKKTQDDFVWWGFPDKDLFEYSKEKISMLSNLDEPFNFTMLTVDTHAIDGYICEDCEEKFDEQYFNALDCSSRKIKEFIEWIQEQDFYENTTIVLCGDHISMQPRTFTEVDDSGYDRTVLDIFINPSEIPENTKYKYASTMDMFPTTLASLGVKIDGNKLGLGTNLFSDTTTIIRKYGLNYVAEELKKNSKFYNTKFIYD